MVTLNPVSNHNTSSIMSVGTGHGYSLLDNLCKTDRKKAEAILTPGKHWSGLTTCQSPPALWMLLSHPPSSPEELAAAHPRPTLCRPASEASARCSLEISALTPHHLQRAWKGMATQRQTAFFSWRALLTEHMDPAGVCRKESCGLVSKLSISNMIL